MLVMSAVLWVFVLRNYSIRAFSDPLNWLSYAADVSSEFARNRIAVGYALFLHLLQPLAGPYFIFLSNLPLLNLLFVLIGVLTVQAARERETPIDAALVGAGAFLLALGFQPGLIAQMVNPFRDPLSHVCLFASTVLLVYYVQCPRHPLPALSFSGLLAGFAYAVREPALVMLAAFTLYALVSWWRDRSIPFWKSAFAFGIPLLVGALPIIAQSMASTGQALLPPQATGSGTGIVTNSVIFKRTGSQALNYYTQEAALLFYPALVGVAWAAARRHRAFTLLILPAALSYTVLYCFYYVFVRRYFYIVSLLLVPLAAAGVYGAAGWVLAAVRRPALKTRVYGALTLLIALVQAGRLLATTPPQPTFRIAEARRFAREVGALFAPDATVLCRRNLCEMIRYFTPAHSYPLSAYVPTEGRVEEPVREGLDGILEQGGPLFVVEIPSHNGRDDDAVLARRLYDLVPVASFPAARYHIGELLAASAFNVYRVSPWTRKSVSADLPAAAGPGDVLRIDARHLWGWGGSRTFARLYLNDRLLDRRVDDGANYYVLPRGGPAAVALSLRSDDVVPADIAPAMVPRGRPIVLDFEYAAEPSHVACLLAGFEGPNLKRPCPRFGERATVALPYPGQAGDRVFAEIVLRCPRREKDGQMPLQIRAGHGTFHAAVPKDRDFHPIVIPLSARDARVELVLTQVAPEPGDALDLDRIVLHRVTADPVVTIDVGDESDTPFVGDGFFRREDTLGNRNARWTSDRAFVTLYLPPAKHDVRLRIRGAGGRPPAAAPPDVRVLFNGRAAPPSPSAALEEDVIFQAVIPRRWVSSSNVLEVSAAPWLPAEHGLGADTRRLGVLIDRIEVAPATGPGR